MEEKLQTELNLISEEITLLDISDESKRNLYRILKGIIDSPNNRVYVKNLDDYKEYISLRISSETSHYQLCIVSRMIDYSGATAGRDYQYPTLLELSQYVDNNQQTINSSLNDIMYYKALRETEEQKVPPESNPRQEMLDIIKGKVEKLQVPERYKNRVYTILERLSEEGSRVYTVKENDYVEYLSLTEKSLIVTKKMMDYSGATVGRQVFPIKSNDLVIYVEEHKDTIDQSLSQGKIL